MIVMQNSFLPTDINWLKNREKKILSRKDSTCGLKAWNSTFIPRLARRDSHVLYGPSTISSDDLAFLQYISGSTNDKKGCHGNLCYIWSERKCYHEVCSWQVWRWQCTSTWHRRCPQYHDMGLLYGILTLFAGGWGSNMISPAALFTKNPLLWIDLMFKLNVPWSVALYFAFSRVALKCKEAKRPRWQFPFKHLDLSSLVYLQSPTEPIHHTTWDLFQETFFVFCLML